MSETPTLLERQLSGAGNGTSATALDAFRVARRKFIKGQRIDMQELAGELGVGRATLYRWVGSREQLIGEVLWSITDEGWVRAKRDATEAGLMGADWVLHIYLEMGELTRAFSPLRQFIDAEPEAAMRVMTSKHSPQQRRVIAAYEDLLREAVDERGLKLRLELHTLAYTLVRIGESFLWTDLITGEEPDLRQAVEVVRVLLT